MGQTPPFDLRIQDSDPPGFFYVTRRRPGPATEDPAWEVVAGPWPTFPEAVVGWRLAGHYVRAIPQDVAAWTLTHIDGWCGGDAGGCPHCAFIESKGDRASDRERNVILASRRNLPRAIGNFVPLDAEALDRIAVLEAAAHLKGLVEKEAAK